MSGELYPAIGTSNPPEVTSQTEGQEPSLIPADWSSLAAGAIRPEQLYHLSDQGQSTVSTAPQVVVQSVTREELIQFHIDHNKVDENGNPYSRGYIRNQRSVCNDFFDFLEAPARKNGNGKGKVERQITGAPIPNNILCLPFSLSEELGIRFNGNLQKYVEELEADSKKPSTIRDRTSIIKKFRESWIEWGKGGEIPDGFIDAIRYLVKLHGYTIADLERGIGTSGRVIYSWIDGSRTPHPSSLPLIQRIEDFFHLERGTLSSKLPEAWWTIEKSPAKSNNPWRAHQGKIQKSTYKIQLTDLLAAEWKELARSYIDPDWSLETGLPKNSYWRLRWNTQRCPTEEYYRHDVRGFMGALCLPTDSDDPWRRGLSFKPEDLSLAFLGVFKYVQFYALFRKGRSHNQLFNASQKRFLLFCEALLRPETGYLWQHPVFGEHLPEPVPEEKWREWCEENRELIRKWRFSIYRPKTDKSRKNENKNKPKIVGVGRDPFEPIRDYVLQLEHPVKVLWDLARAMDSLTPLMKRGSPRLLALHSRDVFFVKLISSNPLRPENHSMMTFIPADWEEFARACATYQKTGKVDGIYVPTDPLSNLYQKPDCSWHLRFNPQDFKNEDGAAGYSELESAEASYDVPIVKDVCKSLCDYIFCYRLNIITYTKVAIKEYRAENNLPALTELEELALDRCPYVLRPSPPIFINIEEEKRAIYAGMEQIGPRVASEIMLRRTRRHISGCKGFSAHACRHLVASHYIRTHPNGWAVAAAALHITERTCRKYYAWVRPADKVRSWNDHYTQLKAQYDAGQV